MELARASGPTKAPGRRLAPAEVKWSRYEFLDFGCSKGSSLDFARRRFRARGAGLGVEIDPRKVAQALEKGFDVVEGDLHALRGKRCVRFVSMVQFLEHLPELGEVERVIAKAAELATDFLYIHHPSFDAENLLLSQGLRLYYHHWAGHTAHVRSAQFFEIFERLGLLQYCVRPQKPIFDSSHASILPSTAPIDQHEYDPHLHGPKPLLGFPEPIYQYLELFVALRPVPKGDWGAIVGA
jgi:SAM-dependent methyltransferase